MSEVTLTTGREPTLKPSACILCECNCGIEVLVEPDTGRFLKIRGDKAHPASAGYTCNKALRLDAYQNGRNDRLTKPLRRREDGTFEEVEWDAALTEIAERLMQLRDEHGGESIFYYGGGGQGNHLGGAYAPATMAAYGARYRSSALAQEKTGEFWVAARMLGRPHRSDFEHCEVAVFVGKNPYQSHGFPRARSVLKEIGKDPSRSMIVIDPVRTQTAELADFHLQLRPGTDLHLLTAMVAVLVQEDLIDHAWLAEHTDGLAEVAAVMREVSVTDHCAVADVPEDLVRAAARRIAEAGSVAMLEDLGIQMNRNSTVVSYVEKLVWLLTGNFAKRGTQYVFSGLAPIARDRGLAFDDIPRTPVSGAAIVSGLIPCNAIPDEILTEHPDRFRAVIVESSNPLHSLADSVRMTEAFRALELVVVIDIAMTETAREADYVLPPPTQYEKYEATFFDFEFPRNLFHLRHPLLEAPAGQLAEPEIHARLCELAGAVGEADYAPLRAALAQGREAFAQAMLGVLADRRLAKLAPVLLYRTLGPTLPDGAAGAAVLWGASLMCAMENPAGVARAGYGAGLMAGDRLFEAILASPHGVVITDDEDDASWQRLGGRRIQLDVPELLDVVRKLGDDEAVITDADYPLVLSAGERRDFTANTILRDPAWRKRDPEGALRVSQADAAAWSLANGDRVRVSTRRGSAEAVVTVVDTMRQGHISLPNGLGLVSQDGEQVGVRLNNLTSSADCDEFVGTPWHKSVPARLEKI
ncbi:molybdopterin-dependent oxidoreductase [Mycobacterium novum]|uniref:Putative oxidoreductase n=1 Tax=Mycobacterium novum TaxID=2492438 RepID=A0A7I7JJJ3_9MYCO|nr:molybdopterin-dependent oxidoreductase [Mycobacterium novum]BBX11920.1 putative oxidoreductase [Mycobacterium novum]